MCIRDSNLAKFAASNKLQRAFMHLAVSFLHKNEMQKMLQMFNRLNTDHHTPLPAAQMTELLAKGRTAEEAEQFRKTVEVLHLLLDKHYESAVHCILTHQLYLCPTAHHQICIWMRLLLS